MYEHMGNCGLLERCTAIDARLATADELGLAHSQAHIQRMMSLEGMHASAIHPGARSRPRPDH